MVRFVLLSPLQREHILRELSVLDLFHLSLCSLKMKRFVQRFTSSSDPMILNIEGPNLTLAGEKWTFITPRNHKNVGLRNHRIQLIHGLPYTFCEDKEGRRYCLTHRPQLDALKFAFYLMCIFPHQLNILRIRIIELDDLREVLSWDFLHKSRELVIWDGAVSHEEMRAFLERFQTENLVICCHPGPDFVYDKRFSVNTLQIDNSSWLTRQNLLSLDCARIELNCSTLTATDINAFLFQWLISDNNTLEYILISGRQGGNGEPGAIYGMEGYEELDMNEIVKGLMTYRGTRKRQEATTYSEYYPVPYENGLDLLRHDGKLGTVLARNNFLFVVWQHPWPFAPVV